MSDDKTLRILSQGKQAELAARYFKEFILDRISQLQNKIDHLVQASETDGNKFLPLSYTIHELREQIRALDRAIMKSRVEEVKQTGR